MTLRRGRGHLELGSAFRATGLKRLLLLWTGAWIPPNSMAGLDPSIQDHERQCQSKWPLDGRLEGGHDVGERLFFCPRAMTWARGVRPLPTPWPGSTHPGPRVRVLEQGPLDGRFGARP